MAAHRVAVLRAARRPAGDEREVRRQAPGVVRLEHVVLEDEVARVVPVVRDLVPVVVAHHVRCRGRQRATGIVGVVTGEEAPLPRLRLEAVHLPAVDVVDRVDRVVRAAGVAVGRVVVRLDADVRLRVGIADRRHAVLHRDPVGAGVRAEVGVERAVLLHDDHDVADLVDPPCACRALASCRWPGSSADPSSRPRRKTPARTTKRSRFKADATLRGLLENGVRRV